MYVYVYICVYIYVSIYVYTCMHMHVCMYLCRLTHSQYWMAKNIQKGGWGGVVYCAIVVRQFCNIVDSAGGGGQYKDDGLVHKSLEKSTDTAVRLNQPHAVSHNRCGLCVPRRRCAVLSLSLRLKVRVNPNYWTFPVF